MQTEITKGILIGSNPVRVTSSMSAKLNAFQDRQRRLSDTIRQIADLKEQLNQNSAKQSEPTAETEKNIQALKDQINEKTAELTNLQAEEQRVVVNLAGITFVKEESTPVTPVAETPAEAPVAEAVIEPAAETTQENSLSDELSDFSFDMPSEPVKEENVSPEPISETDSALETENSIDTPESTNVDAELPQVDITEITPNINEDTDEKAIEAPESENVDSSEPVTMTPITPVTPDYDFDQPVIPASDEEIEEALTSNDEEMMVTPEDMSAIDSIINGDYEVDDDVAEEVVEEENKVEEAKSMETSNDVFKLEPTKKPEFDIAEENIDVEPREYGLEDYFVYGTYRDWVYAFAKKVYGTDRFSQEEISELETKPDFISEKAFNEKKAAQIDELISERDEFEENNARLNARLNATENFADHVTDELNDTKASLAEAQNESKSIKEKLATMTQQFESTQAELDSAKQQLEETQGELAKIQGSLSEKEKKLKENKQLVKNMFGVLSAMQGEEFENEEVEQSKSKGMAA